MKYHEYLKTHHWKNTKKELFLYRKGKCQSCKRESLFASTFDGHHLTYENLWHENVKKDLMLLCREYYNGCHYRYHRWKKGWTHLKPSDFIFWITDWFYKAYRLQSRELRLK